MNNVKKSSVKKANSANIKKSPVKKSNPGNVKKTSVKKSNPGNHSVPEKGWQYAFTSGNVEYYQLSDFNSIPAMRALKTTLFYEELRMKCTWEYLTLHTEAVNAILTDKEKINLFDIKKLNDQMIQRLSIPIDIEAVYKVASIVFFDATEDISDFDFSYAAKKIAHWKKHNADTFFLLQPIQQLVPALKATDENFPDYIKVVEAMNREHFDNLLQFLPKEKRMKLKTLSPFLREKMTRSN